MTYLKIGVLTVLTSILIYKTYALSAARDNMIATAATIRASLNADIEVTGSRFITRASDLFVDPVGHTDLAAADHERTLILLFSVASAASQAMADQWANLLDSNGLESVRIWAITDDPNLGAGLIQANNRVRILGFRDRRGFAVETGVWRAPSALVFTGSRLRLMASGPLTATEVAELITRIGQSDWPRSPFWIDKPTDALAPEEPVPATR